MVFRSLALTGLFAVTGLIAVASLAFSTHTYGQTGYGGYVDDDPTIPSAALRDFLVEPGHTASAPMGVVDIIADKRRPGHFVQARFVSVPLSRIVDELGRAANANVVVSRSVADQRVTITLRDIALEEALKAIAITQGLVARRNGNNGLHVLATADEVNSDLAAFRTTRTEVFTLLYPNASDVVRVIGDTFGDRVVVTEEEQDNDQRIEDLQQRFERFDLLEGRSRGLSGSGNNQGSGSRFNSQFSNRFSDRFNNQFNNNRNEYNSRHVGPEALPELTAEEARIISQAQMDAASGSDDIRRVTARHSTTYVTAVQRLNRVIVRSTDPQMLQDVRELIKRLDVPTPLVLLEVRILRVDLSDGVERGFDLAFQGGDTQGSFSTGEIAANAAGSVLPGGTGVDLNAGVFQFVSDDLQARLQFLQSKGHLTSLASPILLTANGEVSRIFSGEEVPIVTGFTEPQVIVADGGTTTLPATPETELRSVGTDLLITANINADRTVTLRLLQETSRVNTDGANILVPSGTTFTSETVDTVQSQSASGTIVARDGLLLAFSGLIEETESDRREQVPMLGDIPLLGYFFSRETSVISRAELVVLVRPFVLSTPAETEEISRNLLDSLSIHPYLNDEDENEDDEDNEPSSQSSLDRSMFDRMRFNTVPSFNQGKSSMQSSHHVQSSQVAGGGS